jgi:hypothetical protein
MQALTLPAANGWQWLRDAFALYRRNPLLLTLAMLSYWFSIMALSLLPFVGMLLAPLLTPALSVAIMNVCRALDGTNPSPAANGEALQRYHRQMVANGRPLLWLGAVYFVYSLAAFGLASLLDGGALWNLLSAKEPLTAEEIQAGTYLPGLQIFLLLMLPAILAYWFAPMLTAWHSLPVAKSLFFSLVASWRNWKAFTVYSLALIGLTAILPGVLLGLVASISPTLAGLLSTAFLFALLAVLGPTLFASFYISYREIFCTEVPSVRINTTDADEANDSHDSAPPPEGRD